MKLPALFRKRELASTEKSDTSYPLYFGEGSILSRWPVNWWQAGKDPVKGNTRTAIVHACVDAYAQTVASIPGFHWTFDDNDIRTKVRTSAASRLMLRPNDYQTRSDFFLNVVKELLLSGNAYIVGLRNDRQEFASLHQLGRSTEPYIDDESKAVFYAAGDNPFLTRPNDLRWMIPARDVCHLRLYCPRHPLVGVSPVTNAAASIAANAAIGSHQATFFENMSRPSGVLSTEMKLTADQMAQLRAAWNEQSKDMNSGGIPILGGGVKWSPMSVSGQDSQLVSYFQMTVEDVARAFRVPLPLVNDNRHSTYNNIEQLIAHWLSSGLGFVIDHIENSFDKFFGFNPSQQRVEFDTDVLLRTDFAGRVEGYTKAIQNALMSPNEARMRFSGLKPVEHGDQPIVQQQMVPLGCTETQPPASTEPAPAPAANEPVDEDTARGAAVYLLRKAMSDNG